MAITQRNDVLVESGGWVLKPQVCTHGGLPQKLASAFGELFSKIDGAGYTPMVYCGHQLVNGTNYMIICKVTYATASPKTAVAKIILHETIPASGLFGTFSILSIETIVEEAGDGGYILEPFAYMPGVLSKDPIHEVFEEVRKTFFGSAIEPLAYCGKQIPSPGNTNLMFICADGVVGSDKVSNVDAVVVSNSGDGWTVLNIKPLI